MSNNKMLIDSSHPEETRVAMVRGNRVDEFDFESEHKTQLRGNIYLAKVTRVEPSLQAAFVDYGGNRHGFLAFSEIHPDYYQIPVADRQALLEADAEDARREAEEDDADADTSPDNAPSTQAESSEAAEEKAPRKRRSRRRSKKASADTETESADAEDKTADVSEEDDDSPETINAENEGDDVVSEPASETKEKPKKRRATRSKATKSKAEDQPAEEVKLEKTPVKKRATSRKKKTETDELVAEVATAESEALPEEAPAKKKRATSRKKKAEPVEEASASDVPAKAAETEEPEETKPAKKRTTRRRSSKAASSDEASQVEAVATDSEEPSTAPAEQAEEDADKEPKAKRSRSRRGRGRSRNKPADTENNAEEDEEENGSIEAVGAEDAMEEVPARRTSSRKHYKIQEVIKRRQILLVQVVKEERGNKGAALTTYLSLAGRYSVLMPNTARGGGISRKITNASDRKRLKSIATGLDVPQGMGVILRTAGASRDQAEIQRDFEYLLRLWENVRTLTLESTAPCLTYEEGSLIKRSIRDLYDKDTGEILVEGEAGFREAKDFMAMLMPDHAKNVKLFKDRIPLFAKMGVEAQLDAMLQPQVTLKSGGYLVINQTEALVAIDVNSGRSTRQHSIEETATQTNLEAADEVARQLRLRDLAGLIVIDFIDMEERRNNRSVEKRLKDALKNDRARIQVGRISHFGLMEMSRQRIRASVLESTTQICPTCDGVGHVRAASSVVLGVLRSIEEQLNKNSRNDLAVKVRSQTALYLLNNKRENLSDLEVRFGVAIAIEIDETIGLEPCVIGRGELARKRPEIESAVQPDTIAPSEENGAEPETAVEVQATDTQSSETSGESKPKRRRRRRRKKSDNGSSETDAPTVEPAEETSSTKETSSDATEDKGSEPTEPAAASSEAGGDETAVDEQPKRRTRRSSKTKVAAEDTPQQAVAEEAPVQTAEVDADTKEAAPSKRRTTRRKSTAPEEVAIVASEEAPKEGSEAPKKEGWWRRKFF